MLKIQRKLMIRHVSVQVGVPVEVPVGGCQSDFTYLISDIPLRILHTLEGQGSLRGGIWDQIQKHSLLLL